MQTAGKTLIVIAGPTAIGKTAMAIRIAQYFNTEILSADSRQFYKETKLGTAKPSAGELEAVKHHFIDSHSVTENFTVGDYEEAALKLLQSLFRTHDVVVLTGGSGLYIDAVCRGFDSLPKAGPGIREGLNQEFESKGIKFLQEELQKIDPEYYQTVDISNPQRLIRALEVFLTTGKRFSAYRTGFGQIRPFKIIKIGLNTDREKLYQQINTRVDHMIRDGLVEEVRSLVPLRDFNALKTVGYTELFNYLDGQSSLEDAIAKIKQNTRNFAKRQLTWFRKDPSIKWFEPDQYPAILDYLKDQIQAKQ